MYLYVVAFGIKKREIEQMGMAAKEIGVSEKTYDIAYVPSEDNN